MHVAGLMPDRRDVLKTALGGAIAWPLAAHGKGVKPDAACIGHAIMKTDALARALQQSTGVPGISVCIVQRDKTLFACGYGVTKAGTAEQVNADTVFQLASVSKPVGATVVAHQIGTGKVGWDTTMQSILPGFKLSDAAATRLVTVGDLYAHRSGLPEHVGDNLEVIGFDRTEIIRRLQYVPLDGFRGKFHYTNMGLTAAAQGVAAVSGVDWAALSEAAIYQPLGMARTSSRFADFITRQNRAVGHVAVDGKFIPGQQQRMPDVQSPAGGVSSSVNDLAAWMSMVLGRGIFQGRRIVPAAALAAAMSPQMLKQAAEPGRPAGHYGFGFNVGSTDAGLSMVNHSGGFVLGAATFIMLVPSLNLGVAVLTNAWPVGVAEAIGLTFFDDVQYGAPRRDWVTFLRPVFAGMTAPEGSLAGKTPPAPPMPPRGFAAYVGAYDNVYYGRLKVAAAADGGLALTIGPAGTVFDARHWSGDDFVIRPYNENAPPGSAYKVSFSVGPVTTATIGFLNEPGLGVFRRV